MVLVLTVIKSIQKLLLSMCIWFVNKICKKQVNSRKTFLYSARGGRLANLLKSPEEFKDHRLFTDPPHNYRPRPTLENCKQRSLPGTASSIITNTAIGPFLIFTIQPTRSTRSSSCLTLSQPPVSSHLTFSKRAISVTAPRFWNDLPSELRTFSLPPPSSLQIIKHHLQHAPLSVTPPGFPLETQVPPLQALFP